MRHCKWCQKQIATHEEVHVAIREAAAAHERGMPGAHTPEWAVFQAFGLCSAECEIAQTTYEQGKAVEKGWVL